MINVIIPAYNCNATLGRTLASLVAQTDKNFEIIVVDDCSTEDLIQVVDEYNNKLNIVYIRNAKNLGCGMSRQVGIDNATQKFITFLDSDDMFMPYTVETFNSIIEANPNTEYLHSHFYEQCVIDNNPALFLHKDNYTACHGKLYNVEVIRKYGIKNSPDVKWADDSYFNSMCGGLMKMSIINIPTMLWVNNKNSVLRSNNDERDKNTVMDFLDAMISSAQFIKLHNGNLNYLQNTIEVLSNKITLTDNESEKLNTLLDYIKENF